MTLAVIHLFVRFIVVSFVGCYIFCLCALSVQAIGIRRHDKTYFLAGGIGIPPFPDRLGRTQSDYRRFNPCPEGKTKRPACRGRAPSVTLVRHRISARCLSSNHEHLPSLSL